MRSGSGEGQVRSGRIEGRERATGLGSYQQRTDRRMSAMKLGVIEITLISTGYLAFPSLLYFLPLLTMSYFFPFPFLTS